MNSKVIFPVAILLLALSACSRSPSRQAAAMPAAADVDGSTATGAATGQAAEKTTATDHPPRRQPGQQQIIELGHGRFLAETESPPIATETDGGITLNFEGTEIREFVKIVLGDLLGRNYVMDPRVSGKVTLATAKPLRKDKLPDILEDILALNGAVLIRDGDLDKVLPKNQIGPNHPPPTLNTPANRDGYGIRIIPLEFIAAREMRKILESIIADGSGLRIDKKRNLLIVSGTRQEIELAQETVNLFDVDWLRGMSMGLYPLDFVAPAALKAELDAILGAMDGEEGAELLGGLAHTIALERLHSILLISSTPAALREVEVWVRRLDQPGGHAGKRLYVYPLQNAKAAELSEILGAVFNSGGGQQRAAELAPGLTPTEIGADETISNPDGANPAVETAAPADHDSIALPGGGDIHIIADDTRNALVVMATPQDYKMVEQAIKKLDIVPLQVLIEASIIEVTLNGELSYGVEWFFKNSVRRGNITAGRGALDTGAPGIGALAPGFSYTILDNADEVRLALNALQEESELNVLSSPSLMVLDNQTALINVGDEIPVPTRQSTSNLDPNSPTVNEIQFRQTGVTLTVTPRVNNGGLVTMEIRQEVSNAVSTTSSDIDAPTIQQRQVESTVAINSGDTIVLGGLIQDTETTTESGVPLLKDIPLLGKLFGQTNNEKRRTELLVLLTPRVVANRKQAREITEEFKRKLSGIEPT